MAFPQAHLYLRFNGSFGPSAETNSEKWSSGLRLAVIGADVHYSPAALQTFANAVHTAASAFHNGTNSNTGSTTAFHNVTVARVGTDGKYLPAQQETTVSAGNPIFGSNLCDQPWNTAGVISLRTDNFRGYASNGRWYYPQTSGAIHALTGRVLGGSVDTRLALAKTLFNAINTAAQTYAENLRICVVSATGSTAAKVTSIRADERLDSIERRENAAPTVWHTQTIAP